MRSSSVTAGNAATAAEYNNLRSDAYGSSMLLPHQESTPGLTVYVESGVFFIGETKVSFAGGSSPTITAPTTNPRIDILTIDTTGTLALTQGTEAASPTAPSYPANTMVLAEIYNVVGETLIFDYDNQTAGQGYITDVRPILKNDVPASAGVTGQVANTVYQNTSGRAELHMVTIPIVAGSGSVVGKGTVTVNSDSSSTPSTLIVEVSTETVYPSTNEIIQEQQITFLVAPGDYYEIVTTTTGTATVEAISTWRKVTF